MSIFLKVKEIISFPARPLLSGFFKYAAIMACFFAVILAPSSCFPIVSIEIDASKTGKEISPFLWGGNIPGWDQKIGHVDLRIKEIINDMHFTVLRFPAGLVSDAYHWKNGVGPWKNRRENRLISKYLPHRKGFIQNKVGTNEFVAFCRSLNASPLITVNCGSGTPEEAADWVEYCNGACGSHYGDLRITHGFQLPYNIKYWEVGNELYGKWHKFRMTGTAYAEKFISFSKLMKSRDPSIKIGIVGGLTRKDFQWTHDVLRKAAPFADFIVFHLYYPRNAGNNLDRDDFARAVMAAPVMLRSQLDTIKNLPAVRKNDLQIAFTEYNTQYSKKPGSSHTRKEIGDLKSALSIAELYNVFIQQDIFMANIWSVLDKTELSLIKSRRDILCISPVYYVLYLYANDFAKIVVETRNDGPFFEAHDLTRRGKFLKVPSLSSIATVSRDGKSLYLIVINRDLRRSFDIVINIKNFIPDSNPTVWTLSGPDPYSSNDGGQKIVGLKVKHERKDNNMFLLPPISLTKIKWTIKKP